MKNKSLKQFNSLDANLYGLSKKDLIILRSKTKNKEDVFVRMRVKDHVM